MTTTLPPDVADLLRAIRDVLAPGGTTDEYAGMFISGALDAVLDGPCAVENATTAIRNEYLQPSTVCDTCHSEPVTVITPDKRQCSTCALKICDCCQVRRATVVWGVTELCPLCAEERAAEAEVSYAP